MDYIYWFVAESDYGQVYVGINTQELNSGLISADMPEVIKMAILMSERESLIQEVEDWLNDGLKLRPVSIIPSSLHTLCMKKKSSEIESNGESIVIGFHGDSLVKLPVPESVQLKETEMTTSTLAVKLVLAEIDIAYDEYERIGQGSIILIPESYDNEWSVKLRDEEINEICCNGVLGCNAKSIRILARNQKAENHLTGNLDTEVKNNSNNISITVSIEDRINIPFERMLCWRPIEEINIERSLKQYKIKILIDNQNTIYGHLISIANGYGVYIES